MQTPEVIPVGDVLPVINFCLVRIQLSQLGLALVSNEYSDLLSEQFGYTYLEALVSELWMITVQVAYYIFDLSIHRYLLKSWIIQQVFV